ncbi:D-xylose-binding periplasmic protein [Neomoorella glycerini]|uniref:D-xylose-binding periplasmic protein n=1 Tax=Neomoorella glycerini TaxID=55779 RepID=A0A6I5ZLV2_9FIRM|nr:D-xylose ABC transporter substrate-binding protein [Moorella glycerini]QGP90844.1 D-xylose-binding periplasmic protein [Moorella glycerini]
MKRLKFLGISLILLIIVSLVAGCSSKQSTGDNKSGAASTTNQQAKSGKKIRIGLSMDTLMVERWQKDRDLFVQKAKELGADVIVQTANSDAAVQNSQVENMLTQGIDVLVIVPYNAESAATAVEMAHKAGIKVLSYDRLIKNADVDLYISFDNVRVGEMQAEGVVAKAPKGNYVLIGGAPTDNNAKLFREGQMKVLKPLIDKGDIKVVADQWAIDWKPENALKIMEDALTKNNNNIQGVVASNDSLAGAAIQALSEQKLDGKVAVSGQDADLDGCQRIVEGKQTVTVYKPIKNIATKAAELAVALAKGEPIQTNSKVNNGKIDVPSLLLDPIKVTKENMVQTVIKDGYHKLDEVYKNVPKDQWPKE